MGVGMGLGNGNAQSNPSSMNVPSNTQPDTPEGGNNTPRQPPMDPSSGPMEPLDPGMGVTPNASAECTAMCEYLEMCNSCFYDEVGNCLDVPGCAALCDREILPAISGCVAALPACDEAAYQGCYDENVGDDDCAETCRFLEECEECFLDEFGECLSIAGCAVVCRMSTPPAAAACIAQLDACDDIDGCFER